MQLKAAIGILKTRVTAALGMNAAADSYKNTFKFCVTAALGIRDGCSRRQL